MNGTKIAGLTVSIAALSAVLGGCDLQAESELASEQTEYRYIPTYEDACVLEDKAKQLEVREYLANTMNDYEWRVATTMEMCDENSCMPCSTADNPMLQVLRSTDAWGSEGLGMAMAVSGGDFVDADNPDASPLEVYFARALAYPWGQLLLGTQADASGTTTLTLAQGIHKCADGTYDCADYHVAVESLDASCESMAITMPVTLGNDGSLSTQAPSPGAFGFQVPLSAELPPPSSFEDVPHLEAWLQEIDRLKVEMADVRIDWSVSADGGVCATVHGTVDADAFDSISATPTAVDAHANADGRIPTVLSLQLTPAAVDAG
ncbi:MAG: hypothetical protein AAF799_47175 [Myxococcota bacterium]